MISLAPSRDIAAITAIAADPELAVVPEKQFQVLPCTDTAIRTFQVLGWGQTPRLRVRPVTGPHCHPSRQEKCQ